LREIKPDAKILDATAGNRMIWKKKESPHILWIDIESELEVKPDMIMDCTKTIFEDKRFHTVFFDPPHSFGGKLGIDRGCVRNYLEREKAHELSGGLYYYGLDKYKTASQLLSFIHKSLLEFYRILNDDGILWFKWCDLVIPLDKILSFFRDWQEMMRLYIKNPRQTLGLAQTYWILFMKKPRIHIQTELDQEMKKT